MYKDPVPMNCLIIEDDAMLQEMIKEAIEELDIFEVIHVSSDGSDALAKCRNQDYRLIFTDFNMPKTDGLGFVKHFNLMKKGGDTDVVMFSAYMTQEETIKVIKLGVKHIMVKPCGAEDIASKIRSILSIKENRAASVA